MFFSIIIPSYNNPEEVDKLLDSIMTECKERNKYEIIVVDDGSKDDKIESICKKYDNILYFKQKPNKGLSTARNLGAKKAKGNILIFIDSDHIIKTDIIKILSSDYKDKNTIAVVGKFDITPLNSGLYQSFWALYKTFSLPKDNFSSIFYGEFGSIRKEIFFEIGGFNEKISGVFLEEYEFTTRLEKKYPHYKIKFNPKLLSLAKYRNFTNSLITNLKRSKGWTILFLERKKFDNNTTTKSVGLGFFSGFLSLMSIVITIIFNLTYFIPILFFSIYLILNVNFFYFLYKKKGLIFLVISIFFHFCLSISVSLGAIIGILYIFLPKEKRMKVFYK